MRCLILEDHEDTRAGYVEFLRALGFEVRSAADAEALRRVMSEWKPDAIVMDLQLPGTDGWTVVRELKGHPHTRDIVVVVVSACVFPRERQAAEEAGCDAFISKPCDPAAIVAELHARLGRG